MLALSTCWNSSRHTNGEDMLREILDLGFDHVELSHGLNVHMMDGVLKFAEHGKISITSLHNFCPQPIEVISDSPDCYEFSSGREDIRRRAIKMTLQTLDYAEKLGVKRVVLHSGSISPMRGLTRELIGMVLGGQYLSRPYTNRKFQAVQERERLSREYIDCVVETLKPIVQIAGEKGIRLGIENRDSYEQIPSEHEFPDFLDRLGPHCGYWHDFGHAQRKQNLSFIDHADWLEKIGSRAIGCHLHDALWPVEDHRVPFTGDIDYHSLVPYLPKDIPYIIELHPRRQAGDIVEAADRWREEFGA